jgi:hypothetical protein
VEIRTPALERLYREWERKRDGRKFPARADFDPVDLKYVLGNLSLVDVRYDPLRFRYRIHATNVAERTGTELTGQEVGGIAHTEHRNLATRHFAQVVAEREPVVHYRAHALVDHRIWSYEALVLPLSSDGETIDILMSALMWQ